MPPTKRPSPREPLSRIFRKIITRKNVLRRSRRKPIRVTEQKKREDPGIGRRIVINIFLRAIRACSRKKRKNNNSVK